MATATGRETASARNRTRDSNHGTQKPKIEGKTDYSRWRLRDDDSRHTWHYLTDDTELAKWPQSLAEKYFMNLPLVRPTLHLSTFFQLAQTNQPRTGPTRPPESHDRPRCCQQWN